MGYDGRHFGRRASPPLALLDALLRARREPSDALEAEVLAATLEAVAAFTRCFHALDAHVKLSAVLSAPAAEDDGGAPSRAPRCAAPRIWARRAV